MITIKFRLNLEDQLIDNEDIAHRETIIKCIKEAISNIKLLRPFCHKVDHVVWTTNTIQLKLYGLCTYDEKTNNYILLLIEDAFNKIGFNKLITILECSSHYSFNDNEVSFESLKPKSTLNAMRLQSFKSQELIPQHYVCALSKQVMDEPVFIKSNPDVLYDKNHLIYYLSGQKQLMVTPEDIVCSKALKNQIRDYIQMTIRDTLAKKSQTKSQLTSLVKRYTQDWSLDPEARLRAFIKAASTNNISDLSVLCPSINDINAAPKNSYEKETALHAAVQNGAVDSVNFLLHNRANPEVRDAYGLNAFQYADRLLYQEIKALLAKQPDRATNRP